MNYSKRIQILMSAMAALILWGVLLVLGSLATEGSGFQRIIELFGGSASGFIQIAIYSIFFYSLLELLRKKRFIDLQAQSFNLGLLPLQDQLVLSPDEVAQIKLNAIQFERNGQDSLIVKFIKKACTQYRNDNSVSETLQVFNTQVDHSKEVLEGELEMIRYLLGAIISLGFIGTLLGLSSSLGIAHLAKTVEGMPQITRSLNLAFDTTLVALLVGLVLNFYYHRYLKEMDTFFSRSKAYVIDNLISRIYKG